MPRICHITTAHQAGDTRIFERECRSLASEPDYEVVLISSGRLPRGTQVRHIQLDTASKRRSRRFSQAPWTALRTALHTPADIYHFHDPELIPVAVVLARKGNKVIWDAHEDYHEQFLTGAGKEWLPTSARRIAYRGVSLLLGAIDRHAAGVIAATPTIARRYSNPRTVVVGNEARLEDFLGCRPSFGSNRVLYTGRVSDPHCFAELSGAVAAIPGLRLAVAGYPPDSPLWAAARAALGDRLEHVGWLDREGLAAAISQSAVGAVTYADLETYAKAEPTKLFEFAAAGLPVVCTPNPTILSRPEVRGFGGIADDFSADALADALVSILKSEPQWDEMSRSAREYAAAQGAWNTSESRLLALYRDILTEPSRVAIA